MYIADIREYLIDITMEEVEVIFYNRPKRVYLMSLFTMLLTDPTVKEIMSLRTREVLYMREEN